MTVPSGGEKKRAMAELTIAVDYALARELQLDGAGGEEFRKLLDELGVDLAPLHPRSEDAELACWFLARIPQETAAERALEHLRDHPRVLAAYVKPADEMP